MCESRPEQATKDRRSETQLHDRVRKIDPDRFRVFALTDSTGKVENRLSEHLRLAASGDRSGVGHWR
jgi:hypothetical protein